MIPKLRIAAAPGWVPITANDELYGPILIWIAPRPGSHEFAKQIVDALNGGPLVMSPAERERPL
jgi:hypothetical protein